ncbi:MAG: S53 family peptidase [Salinisphaera sp.]|jgi:kumamolisin|nr:S53 family peptidase [Salinisphaera sp.]
MLQKYFIFAPGAVVPNGGQGYFPGDIRQAYQVPDDLDGNGQSIGILEFSNGYSLRDAQMFWRSHGIKPASVEFVSVDGIQNDHGEARADQEASLDLQWAGAIAPGAGLIVYEARAGATYADFVASMETALGYVLNDRERTPSVLSVSYGDAESSFGAPALRQLANLVEQLDAQGVTVCIASGDQGAYGKHQPSQTMQRNADAPASLPHAVAVGGTSLQPDGTETAWSYNSRDNGGATGGGYSDVFQQPDFQRGVVPAGAGRGLPDVALNADPAVGYQIIFQGQSGVVGGTSVAAPVFAAVVALANQRRAEAGKAPLSGLTEQLYSRHANLPFRDITRGNNSFAGVTGFSAEPGWDACTGWGAIDASRFIKALAEF